LDGNRVQYIAIRKLAEGTGGCSFYKLKRTRWIEIILKKESEGPGAVLEFALRGGESPLEKTGGTKRKSLEKWEGKGGGKKIARVERGVGLSFMRGGQDLRRSAAKWLVSVETKTKRQKDELLVGGLTIKS